MVIQFVGGMEWRYYDDEFMQWVECVATVRKRLYVGSVHWFYKMKGLEPNHKRLSIFVREDMRPTITNLHLYRK